GRVDVLEERDHVVAVDHSSRRGRATAVVLAVQARDRVRDRGCAPSLLSGLGGNLVPSLRQPLLGTCDPGGRRSEKEATQRTPRTSTIARNRPCRAALPRVISVLRLRHERSWRGWREGRWARDRLRAGRGTSPRIGNTDRGAA